VAEATDPPNLIWLIPAKEEGPLTLIAVPESGTAFLYFVPAGVPEGSHPGRESQ
jgi:hypothetical protein